MAIGFGVVDWRFAELLFLAAVLYGVLISLSSLVLEEVSFRRYPRLADLLTLSLFGVLENFGYRQLASWWRARGVVQYLRGRRDWGNSTRKGFETAS